MIYPRPTLMLMGIVVISCIHPFVRPSVGFGLSIAFTNHLEEKVYIWHADVPGWLITHRASIPMGIIVISCVHPSIQLSMSLGFGIADKSLGRKVYILACWCIQMTCLQFINAYRYYCPSVHLSGHLGSGLGLGWASGSGWLLPSLRDICCHYWQHILVQSSLADRKLREQKLRGYQNLWCYQTVYRWLSARLQ